LRQYGLLLIAGGSTFWHLSLLDYDLVPNIILIIQAIRLPVISWYTTAMMARTIRT
jgi:hypothetical protein